MAQVPASEHCDRPPSPPSAGRLFHLGVLAIVAVYLVFGLLNIFRLPALNGPDEEEHLRYVMVLRDQHAMPLLPRYVPAGEEARTGDQAQHPPLYYAVMALASSVLPDPPTAAAIRMLKLLSVLMGLVALLTTAACARRLWPEDTLTALSATAALGLLPMFWVMTSLLNNTAGALMASGVTLLLLHRALTAEATRARDWLWVGLAVSLGMLMKVTAGWLVPAIAVVMWARWRREERRSLRAALAMLGPVVLPLAVFVGLWLYYNFSHFGVLMPERVLGRRYLPAGFMTIFFLPFARNLLLRTALVSIPLTAATPFWLMWNKFLVRGPMVAFIIYALPPLFALLIGGYGKRDRLLARLEVGEAILLACLVGGLAAWFVAVEAVLHDWNTGLYAGRYAVDAAPACALLWAAGMRQLLPWRKVRLAAVVVSLGGLLAASAWTHQFMFAFFHR